MKIAALIALPMATTIVWCIAFPGKMTWRGFALYTASYFEGAAIMWISLKW